jgi:hypothetical protein
MKDRDGFYATAHGLIEGEGMRSINNSTTKHVPDPNDFTDSDARLKALAGRHIVIFATHTEDDQWFLVSRDAAICMPMPPALAGHLQELSSPADRRLGCHGGIFLWPPAEDGSLTPFRL